MKDSVESKALENNFTHYQKSRLFLNGHKYKMDTSVKLNYAGFRYIELST